ncbi:hypothetical protein Acr_04g0004300 [Actinidia rufa]|uniref:Uncharacterized protein n=1 Tax=Actinidia rufa TaxID=165716 RepID=A0A7J0EHE3_9ERIC|nr:hypothetical protein Acr_04g0004300 [Actinidia rufa]
MEANAKTIIRHIKWKVKGYCFRFGMNWMAMSIIDVKQKAKTIIGNSRLCRGQGGTSISTIGSACSSASARGGGGTSTITTTGTSERERQTDVGLVRQGLSQWYSDVRGLTVLSWEKDAGEVYNTLGRQRIFLKKTAFPGLV